MTEHEFEVSWGVDDGYAGRSRPHSFIIRDRDLCGDEDEKALRDMFSDYLKSEFENLISYYSADEDAFVEWATARLKEMREEEK